MNLLKRNPMNQLRSVGDDLDYYDDFWNGEDSFISRFTPKVDIEEMDNGFEFHVELPGLDKKDVKINVKENVLTISGEKKNKNEDKSENFHRLESTYGKFQRSFRLPQNVKKNDIKAEFRNGVLDIVVPKAEEAKPKEIEIDVN